LDNNDAAVLNDSVVKACVIVFMLLLFILCAIQSRSLAKLIAADLTLGVVVDIIVFVIAAAVVVVVE
jgi:hypothetical protein